MARGRLMRAGYWLCLVALSVSLSCGDEQGTTGWLGSEAHNFISASAYTRIVAEVDHVVDKAPDEQAFNYMKVVIKDIIVKDEAEVVVDTSNVRCAWVFRGVAAAAAHWWRRLERVVLVSAGTVDWICRRRSRQFGVPVFPSLSAYVEAYARQLMNGSGVAAALAAMRAGLLEVVPEAAVATLTAEDFTLLLNGATVAARSAVCRGLNCCVCRRHRSRPLPKARVW